MRNRDSGGFTLIELLTVIAIIAILAAMSFTVGPRVLEKAKIASMTNTFNQMRTALIGYSTKNKDSFPPAYGYRAPKAANTDEDVVRFFISKPYMSSLDLFRNFGMYDKFSEDSYDTDGDGRISWLEYCPIGSKAGVDQYTFPEYLYWGDPAFYSSLYGGGGVPTEIKLELDKLLGSNGQTSEQRPFIYIPVNSEQAKKVAKYYDIFTRKNSGYSASEKRRAWYAERWNPTEKFPSNTANPLTQLKFPPAKYDDFVLISVGPGNHTCGILTPPGAMEASPPANSFMADLRQYVAPEDWYHVLALRAFFLATRDANDNGLMDFDFRNRTRAGEGKKNAYSEEIPDMYLMPDGTGNAGPIIYRSDGGGV